jgi:uncharacterized membrane protein
MVQDPMAILCVLLGLLALLFAAAGHERLGRIFKAVPLLVFAYFVPTVLSNTGVIPLESPLYTFIRNWLLPASLVLLVMCADIPSILRLGRPALVLFLTGTASVVIGGPLAYLLLGWLVPEELGEEAWKGLAALSGSWIGGGANFIAVGESVGASDSTIAMMVVVDVAVANVWMAVLLYFSGRADAMDARIAADRSTLDAVQTAVEQFHAEVERPTDLKDLLVILFIAFGTTAAATALASVLPDVGTVINGFTWVVVLVTTVALALSFTPLRRLEGAGASSIGSVLLYLLIASIGAKAQFAEVVKAPGLVAVGALWISIHALAMLAVRRLLGAPIFFAAVGSQANIGGAASAPVVAAAFHPALASVGVLLAVGGYVLGTYGGLLCAVLLQAVYGL